MPERELIDGVEISMGGRELTVPPLNLKQLKKYGQILTSLGSLNETNIFSQAGDLVEVIHAAIARNYPEITLDQVEEMLDMNNLIPVMQAIVGVSGLGEPGMGSRQPGASSTGS